MWRVCARAGAARGGVGARKGLETRAKKTSRFSRGGPRATRICARAEASGRRLGEGGDAFNT